MGLLSSDLPASDYWPRSFESMKVGNLKRKRRLELLNGAKLGEEQLLNFTLSLGF